MLSPSLKSEDVRGWGENPQLFYPEQLSCYPMILFVESRMDSGKDKNPNSPKKQLLSTSDLFAHPLPIHHPGIYFTESHGGRE